MSDSPFQAPSPEALAELLPQFAIDGFIAQGGMGAVYSGRQSSLDRDIAVKILPRELGEDPEFRESFAAEAKAMARLNHPNLIGVFDYGDVDGMPYIVMEYVQGSSLHESAWNQAVAPSQAVAIVKGICDGLAHAHENGIVHRDIKPANILLTLKAEPKIGDFGLAHAADSDTPGLVMGTPGYTAPEVFQDPNLAGPLADIYSVGMILHQLLTGIDPAGSQGPPTQATGSIRLDAIWRKATSIHPSQRYASVAEMGNALQKWAANQSGIAIPTGPANFQTVRRPIQPTLATSNHGGGGMGVFMKLVIVAVLGAVIVFTYQLLQEYKEDIKGGIAQVNGHELEAPSNPVPVPDSLPIPDPLSVSNLPGGADPPRVPDEGPIGIGIDDSASGRDSDPGEITKIDDPEEEPNAEVGPGDDAPEDEVDLGPGDPELRERAIGLIEDARKEREQKFAENARALEFELRSRARSAKPQDAAILKQLEADVVANRVPIVAGVRDLPEAIDRLFEHAHRKEVEIESGYLANLTRIRDAYVSRLAGAAGETSAEKLKQRLLAQAELANDIHAWVGLLTPEPEIERKRSSGGLGNSFAGRWDVKTDNLTQWVADTNGLVTINDGQWKGKTANWTILEDGTLEIHWPDKPRPYILTRSGDGWTGKTSFGRFVAITPGDW